VALEPTKTVIKRVDFNTLDILDRPGTTTTASIQTVTNSLGPAGSRSVTPHVRGMRKRNTSDSSIDSSIMSSPSIMEPEYETKIMQPTEAIKIEGTGSQLVQDAALMANNQVPIEKEVSQQSSLLPSTSATHTQQSQQQYSSSANLFTDSSSQSSVPTPSISMQPPIASATSVTLTSRISLDKKPESFPATKASKQGKKAMKRKEDPGCQCTIL
jgi:hypothetical protein